MTFQYNRELRDRLNDLDESDEDVSDWAADFLENVLSNYLGPLSDRQIEAAEDLLEQHGF